MGEPGTTRIDEADLLLLVRDVLETAGAPRDIADAVARASVDADLDGRGTHGVGRIPAFVAKVRAGGLDPTARPQVIHESGAVIAVDARDGFGQVALDEAARMGVTRARTHGIAMVTVRNLTNPGMLSSYGRSMADAGCIGILGCNAAPVMAPHGARSPFLGTNPLCIVVPAAAGAPMILDMATTATSKAAVARAARRGEAIPEGWATDGEGLPTTDPRVALGGLLLPAAGAKGSGLALAIDILAGLLAGAAAGPEVRGFQDPGRSGTGAFVIAILPAAWPGGGVTLSDAVVAHLARVRDLPALDAGAPPRAPGDRANEARARNRTSGIPVETAVLESLRALAGGGRPPSGTPPGPLLAS